MAESDPNHELVSAEPISFPALPKYEAPVDAVHDYPDLVSSSPPVQLPERAASTRTTRRRTPSRRSSTQGAAPKMAYRLPDRSLLNKSAPGKGPNAEASKRISEALLMCLRNFGIEATQVGEIAGPRVTRYELQLAPGTKVGKVAALRDDLSYALATTEIRILAPIPGKQAVGVEVPNLSPNLVTLGDIFGDIPPQSSPLSVWLGKGIDGVPGLLRPRADAAPADRRHDRIGQVGLHQRDPHLDPPARDARRRSG